MPGTIKEKQTHFLSTAIYGHFPLNQLIAFVSEKSVLLSFCELGQVWLSPFSLLAISQFLFSSSALLRCLSPGQGTAPQCWCKDGAAVGEMLHLSSGLCWVGLAMCGHHSLAVPTSIHLDSQTRQEGIYWIPLLLGSPRALLFKVTAFWELVRNAQSQPLLQTY